MPTREQVKELLPILSAYVEGKVIQLKHKDAWLDVAPNTELSFNNDPATYRIKPEPVTRTRPFTLDEFRKIAPRLHWVRYRTGRTLNPIGMVDPEANSTNARIEGIWLSLKQLAADWMIVNPDGSESPFGVVEVVE
jgi:hypothetical protein